MASGTVKWFNADKGYGFIEVEGGGKDAFVHVNQLSPGTRIAEGDRVSFQVESREAGPPMATAVAGEAAEDRRAPSEDFSAQATQIAEASQAAADRVIEAGLDAAEFVEQTRREAEAQRLTAAIELQLGDLQRLNSQATSDLDTADDLLRGLGV